MKARERAAGRECGIFGPGRARPRPQVGRDKGLWAPANGESRSGDTGEVRGGAGGWARVKSDFIFPILPNGYLRSEERRVGKECNSQWSPERYKKDKASMVR